MIEQLKNDILINKDKNEKIINEMEENKIFES
jgi:hypothetical protein